MRGGAFPKGGRSNLAQKKFPAFGYVYLGLMLMVQTVSGGIKAAKIIFLVDDLRFSENEAVIIIHLQASLMEVVMVIGSILAHVYFSPYRTCIFQEVFRIVLTCPMCTLATMGLQALSDRRLLYLGGQLAGVLTAFGNTALVTLLADQFNQPNYLKFNRAQVVITMACSAIGILTAPHLIQYFQCFWMDTCYSSLWLAEWGLCLVTLFIYLVFFKKIEKKKLGYSTTCMLLNITCDAIRKRRKEKAQKGIFQEKPLLSYSKKYDAKFRKDAQKVLSMWTFYFPLACYWALYSQQSTTWILQAKRLNGDIFGWCTVLPNELWGVIPLFGVAIRMIMVFFMEDTKHPLRVSTFSQLVIGLSFMSAAVLERYIMFRGDQQIHMVWALPQLILLSFSDVTFMLTYRKFIIRDIPANFRGVTQNLFVLSRCFGNAIIVVINLMEMLTGFPNRFSQFIIYATALNLLLIIFTLLNRKFERLLQDESNW